MASAIVRLLVTVVMLGVCAVGWTEAAPQVNHWHDATNALYPIDYMQTLCERDCPGEPSFMCDFYECDEDEEEDESANEVDNDLHEESEEEYYDEEDEMEDHYTDLVHEVFDCGSNKTLTCTTASTTPNVKNIHDYFYHSGDHYNYLNNGILQYCQLYIYISIVTVIHDGFYHNGAYNNYLHN
uniref:Uncharacterized protein n=1 Tax=Anopheles coluzzii TaxID=1518534 RepID=A0A8W7PYR0_ANOCL